MPPRLSVLDQSPISEGMTAGDALRNSVDLAQLTDALGYERYWVAEHHGTPMLASTAPEILIAEIAAATPRIRVGSGGVMLPHYSPLKVAETFSMLAALHGPRIDLGIGRAPGSDRRTMVALQRDKRLPLPDDFPEQLAELLAYDTPEVWLLGSSPQSAIWAGELGLPYAFADFINPAGAEIAELYRSRFTPSAQRPEPEVVVAVSAIAAGTDADAERLSLPARMAFTLLRQGRLIQVPTVERAERFFAEGGLANPGRRFVVGSAATVRAGLEAVAAEYGAGEVMVVTITHDHEARRRSYELLAAEFSLL